MVAKVAATVALGLLVSAVMFVEAAVGNVLGAALQGGDGSWSFGPSGFLEISLVQLIGLLEGMAFGMSLLVSAAAIVSFYVVPNVWSALFASAGSLESASTWVDLNKAAGNLYNQQITAHGWLQLLVAAGIWIAAPAAIGIWRIRHTEVTSG
jgi:ABC-2 type transport system permease protein